MPVYHGKLLELKGVNCISDNHFLHVRLSFEQEIEMFWKVDEYTAENLKSVAKFDDKYRYRLSFKNFFDITHNQGISVLTRTYCEQSEQLHFLCSEDYINNLNSIRTCNNVSELDKLVFTSTDFSPMDEPQEEEEDEEKVKLNIDVAPKQHTHKIAPIAVAVFSVIFFLLFGYLGHLYLNNLGLDEKALAESIEFGTASLDDRVDLIKNDFIDSDINVLLASDDDVIIKKISDVQSQHTTIPFIDLENLITYGLPEGKVALTFDDGPSEYSVEIIDILKEYDVGGTFFLIGLNMLKYPEYVKYIHSNGYSIGSHSMNHVIMSNVSAEKQKSEMFQSMELLEEIAGEKIILFRPPYGSFNKQVEEVAYDHQYKLVLWNNDPEDWKVRDADKIFNNIKNTNVSGSIILLHESKAVINALPQIIEYLQDLGLEIVSLK